jgi:hypothetical protein
LSPWEKYGAAPEAAGPWAKYAPAAEPTNPAAANPEATRIATPFGDIPISIKGEIGDTAMFNPAAALIKAGDFLSRVNRGVIEAKDAIPSMIRGAPSELAARAKEDSAFARQPMKELEAVHPGSTSVGEFGAMAMIPPAALPIVGALEEGSVGERATRAGFAAAGNKAATVAGKYLGAAPERAAARQSQNAERDALVAAAKAEGYTLPPSASGGGSVSRTLEGLSGKAKTEQLGTVRNRPINDKIARRELGLADDAPLNEQTLAQVRSDAYTTGYKPITDLPEVVGDVQLLRGLKQITPNATGGAIKSPARADIDEMVGALASQGRWSGAELVKDIQALREQSRALYGAADRSGGDAAKTALAKAQREAADLLEKLAERNIVAGGGSTGAVKALRDARKMIAKAHDVEDALVSGSVDVTKLRGDQLTDGLKLMSQLGRDKGTRGSVVQPVAGANVPITVLDTAVASALGLGGAGVGGFAWPAARAAARYSIMSPQAQRFIRPDYDPSLFSRAATPLLQSPQAPALAGMFGYELAGDRR